jgi:hypothetical protein
MSSGDVLNAVLVLALVGFVLYRQTIARPVVARQLVVLPAILIIIGISAISHVDHGHLSSTATTYLAIDLVTSLALGAVRGCFVHVYSRDGVMWRQGGRVTIALWLVAIGVRVVIGILASNAGVGSVSDAALEAAFGLSLLGQNAVVALRGSQQGIPFALQSSRGGGRGRDGGRGGRSFPQGFS